MLVADGIAPNPDGVLANDTDVSNFTRLPFHGEGTLIVNEDGTFHYTPPLQFIGTTAFSYRVTNLERVTLVDSDVDWKYIVPDEDPGIADPSFHSDWHSIGFEDQSWLPGTGLMGYGGIGNLPFDTVITPQPQGSRYTCYFRHEFQGLGGVFDLTARLIRDDGAILYLNGIEVGRSHGGGGNFEDAPDTFLLTAPTVGFEESEEQSHGLGSHPINSGANVLAVSLHNGNGSSADLGLHFLELCGTRGIRETEVSVSIDVADGMRPPSVREDQYLFFAGDPLDSTDRSSLYANDGILSLQGQAYDPVIELVISGSPAGVVSANKETGHFVFAPSAEFTGTTSFQYQVRDKDGLSDPATVKITVASPVPQDSPVAFPDSYSVVQGQTLLADGIAPNQATVLANDHHATGADIDSLAEFGSLSLFPDGSFEYRSRPNFIGTDTFGYSAQNGVRVELIGGVAQWRWFHPLDGVDPVVTNSGFADWAGLGFDDARWNTGFGLMGYGNIESAAGIVPLDTFIGLPNIGRRRTGYFRYGFGALPGNYTLELELSRDDGAIVYLNGEELVRSHNAGATGFSTGTDEYSLMVDEDGRTEDEEEGALHLHRMEGVELSATDNLLAISLHNSTGGDIAISSDIGLFVKSFAIVPFRSPSMATVEVTDGGVPLVVVEDRFKIAVDDTLSGNVYSNDDLFDATGVPYDPILGGSTGPPAIGQLISFDTATGDFEYQPPADYVGTASFAYRVMDKDGYSNPAAVQIEVRDRVEAWATRFFGENADPAISDDYADPDRDRIINLLEYAFGRSPLHADDPAEVFPSVRLKEGGVVEIEFNIPSPPPSDISYRLRGSDELDFWSTLVFKSLTSGEWIGSSLTVASSVDAGRENVVVEVAGKSDAERFFRLDVRLR